MARAPPLTDLGIKTAKPRDETYKLANGGDPYLEATLIGTKYWRMSYTQSNHKKTRPSFCAYPIVTLAGARKAVEHQEDDRRRHRPDCGAARRQTRAQCGQRQYLRGHRARVGRAQERQLEGKDVEERHLTAEERYFSGSRQLPHHRNQGARDASRLAQD